MDNLNPGPFYFLPFMGMHKMVEEDHKDVAFYDEIFSPELTLLHGNAFKNEYVGYKNYQPTIPFSKNEEDELIRHIQMYGLLMHDLNLHLDIYPMDKEIYALFKKNSDEYQKLVKEYQDKYDPLFSKDAKYEHHFTWVDLPYMKRGWY